MDWTQIVITTIGAIGSACTISLPIILPIILNRSHKKTREFTGKENELINSRIDKIEAAVNSIHTTVKDNNTVTQGLHLLDMIEHRPQCWETIRQAFTSYAASGGNGHVERVYRKWEEDYGSHYDIGEIPPAMIKAKRNKSKEPPVQSQKTE